ncbi:hypothetical protein ST201phi2-1p053 [Pseudomonas phage 201phi2-1]|uniref:Uncharacterized protein n=1 Tax=Pseudomonas phage 201phi2-1 TaxID=198110 RepID=B3FK28_BP201|nr:hypothetical protein ST201phi2-1p053 [Pseudomonas phage 201phi2-1]ABY62886.1 hypothetical protein 201phi2-1p053 [Pseudomonas phage 201phi2-1]
MDQSSTELLVKEMAKKGFYVGERRPSDDVDLEVFVTITRPSPSAEYLGFKRTKPRPANIDSDQYFEVQPVVKVVRRAGTGDHMVLATNPITGLGDIEMDTMIGNGGRAERRMGKHGNLSSAKHGVDGGWVPPLPVINRS